MKTVKDITNALKQATQYEAWMDDIERDERVSVQKAWNQFQKKLQKQQLHTTSTHENSV